MQEFRQRSAGPQRGQESADGPGQHEVMVYIVYKCTSYTTAIFFPDFYVQAAYTLSQCGQKSADGIGGHRIGVHPDSER